MENLTMTIEPTMNMTTNMSCTERRLIGGQMMILGPTAILAFRIIQATLLIVTFPIGLVLNSFVLVLVAVVKRLHQISFYLALQVIAVDLLITIINFPTTTANVVANGWVFGAAGCPSIGFFLFTLRNMRNFLMFVFVTDRMLTVFAPFWYYKRNNRKAVVIPLSVTAWVFAIIYGLIPMPFFLDCHEYNKIAWGCTVSRGCKYPKVCDAYKNASVVLSNVIGGFIPLLMYIVLYCKARQLKKKAPRPALSNVVLESSVQDHIKPDSSSSLAVSNSRKQSVMSSSSMSDSSSSTKHIEKRHKQDQTANITFAILFIALIGVSFPSTCFFVIGTSAFSAQGVKPSEAFIIFQIIFRSLFNFLVVIDPIAIMRNRDVKIALRECYKQLRCRIRGETQPIHAIGYIPQQAEKRNSESDLSSISEREDYMLRLKNPNGLQQKNILEVNGEQSFNDDNLDRKRSVTFEILKYNSELHSNTQAH